MEDEVDQLAYCREHMLQIWERWTDGNQAVRRFLESTSADPVTHEEALRRLLDASVELSRHGDTPGIRAALAAASACCNANIRVPAEQFLVVCERAELQDRAAQWTLPTGQMLDSCYCDGTTEPALARKTRKRRRPRNCGGSHSDPA